MSGAADAGCKVSNSASASNERHAGMRASCSRDGALHQRAIAGDAAAGVPVHAGYTLGFHIVEAYLRAHPGTRVSELIGREATEVPAESGYVGVA
jgi:uncharacterized protein YjaZ